MALDHYQKPGLRRAKLLSSEIEVELVCQGKFGGNRRLLLFKQLYLLGMVNTICINKGKNVKKLIFAMSATVLLGTGCTPMGSHDMSSGQNMGGMKSEHGMMGGMMMKMDTNGDGMLSKEEFMKGHEAMFDHMKGPNGMISLKDMQMKGTGKMDQGNMVGQENRMPGGMEKGVK